MARSIRQRIGDAKRSIIDIPVSRIKGIVKDPSSSLKKEGTIGPGSSLGGSTSSIPSSRDVKTGGGTRITGRSSSGVRGGVSGGGSGGGTQLDSSGKIVGTGATPKTITREQAKTFSDKPMGSSISAFDPFADKGIVTTNETSKQSVLEKLNEPIGDTKSKSKKEQFGSFFFGESGESFVGFGGVPGGKPLFTFRDIKTKVSSKGLGGEIVGNLIPTTIGGVGIFAGFGAAGKFIPPIVRFGLGAGIGVYEGRKALDPTLPKSERISSGIVAGLGFSGAVFEGLPFVKGGLAKFNPKFKGTEIRGVKSKSGEIFDVQFIKDVDIGIIKPGKGPSSIIGDPALLKGGQNFKSFEQNIFGKKDIVSSQISLVKGGKGEIVSIDRFFFGTPEQSGFRQTRISRAGITDFLKIPKGDVKFSFKSQNPQFILFEQAPVTKSGGAGKFRGGAGAKGQITPELEVVTFSDIKIIEKLGPTTIKGQRVDIFKAELLDTPKSDIGFKTPKVGRGKSGGSGSSGTTFINPLGSIGTGLSGSSILGDFSRPIFSSGRPSTKGKDKSKPSTPRRPPSLPGFPPSFPSGSGSGSLLPIFTGFSPPSISRSTTLTTKGSKKKRRKGLFDLPKFEMERSFGKIKSQRKFQYTPSYAGVTLPELNFKVGKFTEAQQRTGLVSRGIRKGKRKPIKSLGPTKIKRRKFTTRKINSKKRITKKRR